MTAPRLPRKVTATCDAQLWRCTNIVFSCFTFSQLGIWLCVARRLKKRHGIAGILHVLEIGNTGPVFERWLMRVRC